MTDKKTIKRGVFTITFLMLFLSLTLVSALTDCTTSVINLDKDNMQDSFVCNNFANATVVTLSISSGLSNYVLVSPSSISPLDNPAITIIASQNTPTGNYSGSLIFSDSSSSIPIHLSIQNTQVEPVDTDIIVFPTSKIVNVQQGKEKTQNVLISVPSNYPRTITISSVTLEPEVETISFGDLNLGQIVPGSSIQIPIIFSAIDAQTGSYSTYLDILATDLTGRVNLPKVSLTIQVTAGVTPVTEETFSTPPTCSLSSSTFTLNTTYSFTCSNTVSNLDIVIPSNDYYIGKKVETSQNIYRYDFTAVKYGNTYFKAEYRYKGASIFTPFSQEIKISSTGTSVPGTNLKIIFTPALSELQDGQEVLIQLADNKTGSLVTEPRVWVNAKELNGTGETFKTTFVAETDYEVRGKSPGYDDLIQTFKISPKPITIVISPTSGDTSTIFSINTSVENATLFVNDAVIENPYSGTLKGGLNVIKAVKKGYTTTTTNLSVTNLIRILSGGENFKKGALQTFILNQNTSYKVYYQNSMDATSVDLLTFGDGTKIEFTPDKKGFYKIEANGTIVGRMYEIKGFSFKDKWWFMPAWVWILLIAGIIILTIIIMAVRRSNTYEDKGPPMVMSVGGGD